MSSEALEISSCRGTDNRFEYPAVCWHAACDTLFTHAAILGLGQQREVCRVVGQYVGMHAEIRTLKEKQ